jgi:ring-1,2-phenylacetyl-CoA epoxidase subunit PaaE
MSEQFHNLSINKVVKETKDATSIYLTIPEELKSAYDYIPGQYLTFEAEINGEKVRRAYSLCTSPFTDSVPAITVKKVDGGRMSNYLNDSINENDSLMVMVPNGKFTLNIDSNAQNHYVLFGGGSGITPLMSITKSVLEKEAGSRVTLIYCNRDEDSVIFKDQLTRLEQEYSGRLNIHHSYDTAPAGWDGLSGYLTSNKIAEILSTKIGGAFYRMCHYYICGPAPLMDVVTSGLKASGVADSNVNTEYFTAPTSSEPKEEVEADEDFDGTATVKVAVYGEEHTIECDEHKNILDAAIDADLDPPYSCTVGVCTTCRAKVVKGKVAMKEREGLSDAEIEEGYVLTCQSFPKSNEIELIYE